MIKEIIFLGKLNTNALRSSWAGRPPACVAAIKLAIYCSSGRHWEPSCGKHQSHVVVLVDVQHLTPRLAYAPNWKILQRLPHVLEVIFVIPQTMGSSSKITRNDALQCVYSTTITVNHLNLVTDSCRPGKPTTIKLKSLTLHRWRMLHCFLYN